MKRFSLTLSLFSALLSGTLFLRRHGRAGWALYYPRLLAGALAPINTLLGGLGSLLGLVAGSPLTALLGLLGAGASLRYLRRAVAPHPGFEQAFGADWAARIPAARRAALPQKRWSGLLPAAPAPGFRPDVPYANAPDGRPLLCDLWSPPPGVAPSGLAFIYFHGGAWYLMDKDTYTRPFFRQLLARGHLVMDVSYRVYPEADIQGMTGDCLRAVAWLKANAARLGVDPGRIVLGGGSAGGHLALLAGYAAPGSALIPPDLAHVDLGVRGVVSLYGPPDLRPVAPLRPERSGLFRPEPRRQPPPAARLARRLSPRFFQRMGVEQMLQGVSFLDLLGAAPDASGEAAERAELLSPICHVRPGCPPTLLLQGEGDMLVPAESVARLYQRLQECGVPAIYVGFPQTEHAFDFVLPAISPTFQAALYDILHFLELMAGD